MKIAKKNPITGDIEYFGSDVSGINVEAEVKSDSVNPIMSKAVAKEIGNLKETVIFHDKIAEYEEVLMPINIERIIGIKDIAKTGIVTLVDDTTSEVYILGINNGLLYIRKVES